MDLLYKRKLGATDLKYPVTFKTKKGKNWIELRCKNCGRFCSNCRKISRVDCIPADAYTNFYNNDHNHNDDGDDDVGAAWLEQQTLPTLFGWIYGVLWWYFLHQDLTFTEDKLDAIFLGGNIRLDVYLSVWSGWGRWGVSEYWTTAAPPINQ